MGIVIGTLTPNKIVATLLAPLMTAVPMMFVAVVVSWRTTPNYFCWLRALSPYGFAFDAVTQSEYDGLKLVCEPNELVPVETPYCRFTDGAQYIASYNLDALSIAQNAGITLLLTDMYLALSFLVLRASVRAAQTGASKKERSAGEQKKKGQEQHDGTARSAQVGVV